MAFKHKIFDFDYRNDSIITQKATIDTFFQNNNVESWSISSNETVTVTYDESIATNPTRFDFVDFGVGGVKTDLVTANTNAALDTLVGASQIISQQLLDDRILVVQYREGSIFLEDHVKNQRIGQDGQDILAESGYAEIAVVDHIASEPQQTGINGTFVKINQFNSVIRSKNITISGANNNITILQAGYYKIEAGFSMTGSTNTNFEILHLLMI